MKRLFVLPKRNFFGLPEKGVRGEAFKQFEEGKIHHAAKTAPMWRNIFFLTGIPVLIGAGVNSYLIEKEHFEHLKHHPIEYKELPYLHIRNKPFPWKDGSTSLFYTAEMQPKADS